MADYIEIGNIIFETTGLYVRKYEDHEDEEGNFFAISVFNESIGLKKNFPTKEARDARYDEIKHHLMGSKNEI